MKRLPPTAERLLIGITLTVAFLLMASVIAPDLTQAGGERIQRLPSVDVHEGLRSLGVLEDDEFTVYIFASESGPVYSVYDQDGAEQGLLLTAEQVAARFPELPLPDMDFGGHSPLMLAEPEELDF